MGATETNGANAGLAATSTYVSEGLRGFTTTQTNPRTWSG